MPFVRDPTESLRRFWGLESALVSPLGGGMNSRTWSVVHQGSAYVAKSVSSAGVADLLAGCQVATTLAEAGLVTGRPVPTRDGRLVVTDPALALLEHVPGRELDGDAHDEQEWIANTLARVHAANSPTSGPGVATFAPDWLSPLMPGVAAHPWLPVAIETVRAETDPLIVTWSVLHTDPAPEAFIHDDRTGVIGLVDWAGARRGPVLYDIASAVMYLGGTQHAAAFLARYQSQGLLGVEEWLHIDVFRRFREVVQGVYFAGRLAAPELTGVIDQAENEKGLFDARRRLAELGIDSG